MKPLIWIAGPCVIENLSDTLYLAEYIKNVGEQTLTNIIFKASFDKANRTSPAAYRGPGLQKGLEILAEVKRRYGLQITTDVHEVGEVHAAAQIVDIIQIPAFLCRQTDLLQTAARTGKIVNVKKGQFYSASNANYLMDKLKGAKERWLTERGTTFGSEGETVIDFRSIRKMKEATKDYFDGQFLVDVTHPSGAAKHVPDLAKAAAAIGADGIFLEVHQDPSNARSDGPLQLPISKLKPLIDQCNRIRDVIL